MVIRKEDCVSLPTDACGMTIAGVFFGLLATGCLYFSISIFEFRI